MRLVHKLILVTLGPTVLIWAVGSYAARRSEESLRATIEASERARVRAVLDEVDRTLQTRIAEMRAYTQSDLVRDALAASNAEFAAYGDIEATIEARDHAWTSGEADTSADLVNRLTTHPVANDLRQVLGALAKGAGYEVFGEAFLTNRYGANVAQTRRTEDYAQADEDWWREAWRTGAFVGDVAYDESADAYAMDVCLRVSDAAGTPLGILKAVLDVREVLEIIDARAPDPAEGSGRLVLLTAEGRLLRRGKVEETPLGVGSSYLAGIPALGTSASGTRDVEVDGQTMLRTFARSRGLGEYGNLHWILLSERSANEAYAPVGRLRQDLIPMVAAASILALLGGGSFALALGRRVRRLTRATVAVAKGQLDTRVQPKGRDEVSDLGRHFDRMAEELERTTVALRRSKEEAEAATAAKSIFLANMSHEIRTPMSGVVGVTELLERSNLDARQRELLGMLKESGQSLLHLINDILDFSKIEADKVELERVPFSLREVMGRSIQSLSIRAEEQQTELLCRVDPATPDALVGDPVRLRQVIVNLVGNAVKFTRQGEVVVDVRHELVHAGRSRLLVSVRDTGIGVPPAAQQAIFEAFSQADSSTTRRYGGTGLGLAISARLVALMGGEIWLDSEVGKGSTFSFTAVFDVADVPGTGGRRSAAQLAGLPVLLVDDNATNRRILAELLDHWRLAPAAAENAARALEMLTEAAVRHEPYPLVLLDYMMPDMDGLELARRIFEDPSLDRPHLILLSSGVGAQEVAESRRLGVARVLMKPVVESDLLNTILALMAPDEEPAVEASPEVAPCKPIRRLRLLLAEDGPVNRRIVEELVRELGHEIEAVRTGREAVQAVQHKPYDLVLMDLQMPEMDGYDAARRIRAAEAGTSRHLPIVALTAAAMQGDAERSLAAGMDAHITKPIDRQVLQQTLDALTARRTKNATGETALPQAPGPPSLDGDPGEDGT